MHKSKFDWKITSPDMAVVSEISGALGLPEPISRALVNRGVTSVESAGRYLSPSPADIHDPFMLEDMDRAVERVEKALASGERILVLGDYDVDGISGAALLVSFLKSLGGNVNYYIPDRETEGYGLNAQVVKKSKAAGYGLIITVDSGVSAIAEAELARGLGVDLIVIDHHEPHDTLPDALAVVNPKRPGGKYPFRELAGVGVAFKFVMALGSKKGTSHSELLSKYAELVALGTIGDLVSLLDENRLFVTEGLKQMGKTGNPGVSSLIEVARFREDDRPDTYLVSFGLAPRINAAGRVWNPRAGVELLLAESEERAAKIARKLDQHNRARIAEEGQIFKEAEKIVANTALESDRALIVFSENWNVGIIGIVASRLIERRYMPVILITLSNRPEDKKNPHPEKGRVCQGSVRSIPEIDIYDLLSRCRELLISYGGHPMAAGIKIYEKDIPLLRERLNSLISEKRPEKSARPTLKIDDVLALSDINADFLQSCLRMEPCGAGNPRPLFMAKGVTALEVFSCGADGKHLRMRFGQNNTVLDAIGFNFGPQWPATSLHDHTLDIVFSIREDNFRNKRTIKLHLVDLRSAAG